jgi:flagellin
MRINHNISSMTAQGSLFKVNRDTSKSLQKLSTGLRINAASDDAAGLGVSENLRTQVKGMQMAFRNTQDAISLLQIADGALNEQADILQRMREIIIQAKNDTYTQNERDYMFQEFSGLMGELDRIATVTNYNGMQIFAAPEAEQVEGQALYSSTHEERTPHQLRDGRDAWTDPNNSLFGADDYSSANHFNMMIGGNYSDIDNAAYDVNYASYQNSASNMIMIQFGQMDANALLTKDPSISNAVIGTGNASLLISDFQYSATDQEDVRIDLAYNGAANRRRNITPLFDHILKLIDGDDADIPLSPQLRSSNGSNGGRTHNATGLARINQMRANIGAFINRLDHASNNLLNQISNTQSAESIIRDADFATESATFSKNQILTQSSTSMLAQSNMVPQSVLTLLG